MSDDLDFYDLLGVSEEASQEEIRKGFRTQVREYHPDLNDDPRAPAQFTALKKAYETLRDEKERDAYDRMGHDEYCKKRISGLPSPEDWNIPEDAHEAGDDRERSAGRQRSTSDEATAQEGGSGGDRSSRSSGSRSPGGPSSGTNAAAGNGSDATQSRTSTTKSQSRTSTKSRESGGASLGHQPSVEGGPSRSLNPEAEAESVVREEKEGSSSSISGRGIRTGAGTARSPDAAWADSDDDDEDAEEAAATVEESTPITERIRSGVDGVVAATIGWPLIVAADAMFGVTLALYAIDNATGLRSLAASIRAAGLDAGALWTAVSTRPEGMDPFADFLVSMLAGRPILGTVALVGLAFLPSVYFFMIRWTRENRLPWQPSYLYVVGALVPILGLALSASGTFSTVYVELITLGVVPVLTIFSMLFFGQLKPRFERMVRAWRYRRSG